DHLQAFSNLGFDVAGVDTSPNIAAMSDKYEVHIADLEHNPLPFPNNSFDYVFSKSVIEHMRYPDRLMSKALDVLRPGGTAVLLMPAGPYQSPAGTGGCNKLVRFSKEVMLMAVNRKAE